MKTRSIDTTQHDSVCDVCGRTLLRGEHTEPFLASGRRFEVCELCKPRALHEGWMREGTIPDYQSTDVEPPKRGGLFRRRRTGADADPPAKKKRGRGSLDDELAGDGWNPHRPMTDADFHDPGYQPREVTGEPAAEQPPRERQRSPASSYRDRAAYEDAGSAAPPPRRPSRRGIPARQYPDPTAAPPAERADRAQPERSPGEPDRIRFTPSQGALSDGWPEAEQQDSVRDDERGRSSAQSSRARGTGAIEAWEAEQAHTGGWLDQPVAGESEIFDAPSEQSWSSDREIWDDEPAAWDENLAAEQGWDEGSGSAADDRYEAAETEHEAVPAEQPRPAAGRRPRQSGARPERDPEPESRSLRSVFRRPRADRGRQNEREMDPALRQPQEPRQVHAIPTEGMHKAAAAVNAFNDSEHCRTIAGVARSLGAPVVNVTPDPSHAGSVWIVASWELCWYRYEVDISSARASVRQDTQGYELSDLSAEQQAANASANAAGQITLV